MKLLHVFISFKDNLLTLILKPAMFFQKTSSFTIKLIV